MKRLFILIVSLFLFVSPSYAGMEWIDKYCDETNGEVKQAKLTQLTIVSGNKAVVFIYDNIEYQDMMLRNDLAVLEEQTDIRDIEIWVNSPGGVTHTGFAIADMINAAEKRGFNIKGRALGMVASIAVPILLACDTRSSGESSSFMVHEVRGATEGTRSDFKATNKFVDLLTQRYIDILVLETKIKDRKTWENWIGDTEWFSAEKALEVGLIHKIER